LPKASEVGLTDTVPLVEVPSPLTVTVCGLPLAESLKFNVALRVPAAFGANVIFTVQEDDAASVVPQVLLNTLKSPGSAPVKAMLLIVIDVVLLFERVTTFCAPVFPTATDAQLTLVGETEAARQLNPGNARIANAPFVAKPRSRPVKIGAESALSVDSMTLIDDKPARKLEWTRVRMTPPDGNALA
jgi:hypothetical protein